MAAPAAAAAAAPALQPDVEAPLLDAAGSPAGEWQQYATQFYAWLSHVATCVLMGGVCGICLKMFGPPIASMIVAIFVVVLVLAYYGYLNLNWGSVVSVFKSRLDLDADGRVGFSDLKVAMGKAYQLIISFGLSSVGGFCLGFYVSLKLF